MSEDSGVSGLPTLSEHLSKLLGFQVHLPALPQTVKNLDKALARLVGAAGENFATRIERQTRAIDAKGTAIARVIAASTRLAVSQLGSEPELTSRAMEYTFADSILKQRNRETIARLALEQISAEKDLPRIDASGDIDDDWLCYYADCAARKSSSDIQYLWGRILAGKIRQPSSFSLQSLQLLSSLDTTDANLIHRIMKYVINDFIYKSPLFSDITEFITCEELGVITGTSGELYAIVDFSKGVKMASQDEVNMPIRLTPISPKC